MIGVIQDKNTIDGWFLFDNNNANASQEYLLKNQSVFTQFSHIHGDLGKSRYSYFSRQSMLLFYFVGVKAAFGIRTRFDENNPTMKRLEVYIILYNKNNLL